MLALSIRQPYAELILQGRKRIEYRPTNATEKVTGKRFYIYASQTKMPVALEQIAERAAQRIWSDDLAMTPPHTPRRGEHQGGPPRWMLELAEELILGKLPTGVIVGTAVIERVTPPLRSGEWFEWHLTEVERVTRFRKPTRHPQPTWFNPFNPP